MPEELPLWLVRLLNPNVPTHAAPAGAPGSSASPQTSLDDPPSWSLAYPEVPPPQPQMDLILFVARWTCGDIVGEDMPVMAADLIRSRFDSPGLRRLAAEKSVASLLDASGHIEEILRDFSLPVPFPEKRARLTVTRHIARQVIAGGYDPWRAGTKLEMIWGWTPDDEDVQSIHKCLEHAVWDPEHQRYHPTGLCDLIAAYARLGSRTDEQLAGS